MRPAFRPDLTSGKPGSSPRGDGPRRPQPGRPRSAALVETGHGGLDRPAILAPGHPATGWPRREQLRPRTLAVSTARAHGLADGKPEHAGPGLAGADYPGGEYQHLDAGGHHWQLGPDGRPSLPRTVRQPVG